MTEAGKFTGLLEWRCIGPFRGGRVVAVAGDCHDRNVFYFGAVGGGVWKTTDAGVYWRCVSDRFFGAAAVGALAVAESDPNVIYAGTGETTIRIDVSPGDGVYRSTDAGATWTHVGLRETRFIGKIRVHPTDPNTVYVAALGHAFGPNPERGVYKSTDGGATWQLVLFKSERAGAVDLSLDPTNPRRLYAAIWEAHRSPWQISSGGPDSGLWGSTDGGETWTDLGEQPGLPRGIKGKIAVAASPARAGRVWALIEHQPHGGLYRSDDAGATWELACADQNLISRAWYYIHLTADPLDPDTVYVNNLSFWKSSDGGTSFVELPTPHGDNHDLWIDPRDNRRMIQGNDGGATVSLTGGATWSSIYNQPTAQFYHLAIDNRWPYRVYGTQQDNSSVAVPSRSRYGGIGWAECYLAGTGESGYIAVRPDDPDIVYVGAIGSSAGGGNCLQRYDHRTRQIRLITSWPEAMSGYGASEHRQRFAWTYPIVISPHDPNTLYIGGDRILRSTDEGQSWQPISPDLTRADPATLQPTGGPINRDSIGAEVYATVYALVESPRARGVFWAGSDDGRVHRSPDGGASWVEITPPDLPEFALISCIELSPFDEGTAYLVATRYKLDDFAPYLFRTTDHGATWRRIDTGIARDAFTRVVRCDPARRGLLYAGTETGLYLSFDDGASWQPFQLNLPVAPIYDLAVKENDLVVATHGRSFWILDDLTPLHQFTDAVTAGAAHLFQPRTTVRVAANPIDWNSDVPGINYMAGTGGAFLNRKRSDGTTERLPIDVGQNPPRGAIITYFLKTQPAQPISLTVMDAASAVVRALTSIDPAVERGERKEEPKPQDVRLPATAGWNRFVWDLRHDLVTRLEGSDPAAEAERKGPLVAPGRYTLTLVVGDQRLVTSLEVVLEPGVVATEADLQAQYDLNRQIYAKLNETIGWLNRMRDLRAQLDGWAKRGPALPNGEAIVAAASALKERVLAIEQTLQIPDLRPGWADNLNQGVRLLEKLSSLPPVVELADARPTDAAVAVYEHLAARIDEQIGAFAALVETELPALNGQIGQAGVGAVVV